jgi:hypothetical protein
MSYRSTPSELRDYASYLVEVHSDQAPAKVAERLSTLESAGLLAGTVDWKVIGDEIAALLEPDPAYLTH